MEAFTKQCGVPPASCVLNETGALPPGIVLLPGLDGTARLFERFIRAAPRGTAVQPVVLPTDRFQSYDELAEVRAFLVVAPARERRYVGIP
jgi:hypothetical protein